MAGYSFEFRFPARYRERCKAWLRHIRNIADCLPGEVKVRFRTNLVSRSTVEAYVALDGPLALLQHLDRRLPREAYDYFVAHELSPGVVQRVLFRFLETNRKEVVEAAGYVFRSLALLSAEGYKVITAPMSVSSEFQRRANLRRPRRRQDKAIKTLMRAVDGWLAAALKVEDAVVLADQSMEEWLKAECGLPSKSRKGFAATLSLARSNAVISRMEASRLRRYHAMRNRVQHRGGRVNDEALMRMFNYFMKVIDLRLDSVAKKQNMNSRWPPIGR